MFTSCIKKKKLTMETLWVLFEIFRLEHVIGKLLDWVISPFPTKSPIVVFKDTSSIVHSPLSLQNEIWWESEKPNTHTTRNYFNLLCYLSKDDCPSRQIYLLMNKYEDHQNTWSVDSAKQPLLIDNHIQQILLC